MADRGWTIWSRRSLMRATGARRRPESNRCRRLCRPLRSHSATSPGGARVPASGPLSGSACRTRAVGLAVSTARGGRPQPHGPRGVLGASSTAPSATSRRRAGSAEVAPMPEGRPMTRPRMLCRALLAVPLCGSPGIGGVGVAYPGGLLRGTAPASGTVHQAGRDCDAPAPGGQRLRIELNWHTVAPSPNSRRRPAFDATDPASYAWGQYDPLIEEAHRLGWRVLLTVTSPVPRWATANPVPDRS